MKRTFIYLISLLMIGVLLHSCNNQTEEQQVTVEDTVKKPPMTIDQRLAMYANITLKASVDSLTDKETQVLGLLFKACDVMNDIFWLQSYGNKEELFMTIGDEKLKRFTEINYGPWDRFNDNEPFIDGIGKKPIGAAFYPPDIKYLPFIDMKFEDKLSMFTVVKRADDGSLYTQPYKTSYKENLEKASGFIKEASKITEDKVFAKYLNLLSEALLSDNYYDSDMAWLDLKDNNIDIVIGPFESEEDKFINTKMAYAAHLLLKDHVWSKKLETYISYIDELHASLPVTDTYKNQIIGSKVEVGVYDAIYYSGYANAGGKSISINYPKDGRVIMEKGNRKLQFKNTMEAKFNQILSKIAKKLIDPEQVKYVRFEAFFINNLCYEIADAFVVKNTVNNKGPVREVMKDYYANINAVKSDILRLYLIMKLQESGAIKEVELIDNYTTFMADIFRSCRFGSSYAQGTANMVCFNTFAQHQAFTRNEKTGTYSVNIDKMKEAVKELTTTVLMILGDGDYNAAQELLKEKGFIPPQLQKDLNMINSAGIPTDVVFEQGPQVIGLK